MPEKNPLGLGMRNMLGGIELWLVEKQVIDLVEIHVVPDHNIPGLLWSTHLLAGMRTYLRLSFLILLYSHSFTSSCSFQLPPK